MLPKLGLCLPVPNRNVETEFGVKKTKNSFIALPGNGGSQQANAPKPVPTLGEPGRQFYSLGVKNGAADTDQCRFSKRVILGVPKQLDHEHP